MGRVPRLNSAHVIALIALFVALGGSAYAVTSGKNTVKSRSIAKGAVKTSDIANKAVSAAKLKPGAVPSSAIANNSIGAPQLGNVVLRRAQKPLPDASGANAQASCRPGEQPISGGSDTTASDVFQLESVPSSPDSDGPKEGTSPVGWQTAYYNPAGGVGDAVINAWVLCLQ
jgi:hypothetical protein